MDLFGRKRIRDLEKQIESMRGWREADAAKLRAAQNQVEYLVRTIRDMDEQIFKISQNADGTWARVQPNIRTLVDGMTARKVAESNRISDILRPALHDTYTEESHALQQITKGKGSI